jgi:hypothetical protein
MTSQKSSNRGIARVARTLAGSILVTAGLALLVLPGPGLLLIAAGLSVLAFDHHWARGLLDRIRQQLPSARKPRK